MEIVKSTLPNGNTVEYKIVNGTAYHAQTEPVVVHWLEHARSHDARIEITYGDVNSGRAWGTKEYPEAESGYVGRSTGRIKIPLNIPNSRSTGGAGIHDHCIVRIRASRGKRVLYQHPDFHLE